MRTIFSLTITALVACLLLANVASADLHVFTGAGDGVSWDDPANWSPAELPLTIGIGDGADTVLIDGAFAVVVESDVISVAGVNIDGGATLTIASGVELSTNNLLILDGGLILDQVDGVGARLDWGKANRGGLYVEPNGYIAGAGVIRTTANSSSGVQIRSTRSADFDMTGIELQIGYTEQLTIAAPDLGRDDLAVWDASNYAIGKIYFTDRRYAHNLIGTIDEHALYCHELRFGGDSDESARLNLSGINVYVRDAITWGNGSVSDVAGELTVAAAFDASDFTTALIDDSAEPGRAYLGLGDSPNDPPIADAGADQSVIDEDGDGFAAVTLDGSASSDVQGPLVGYDWSISGTVIATGATPAISLPVGEHTITLTVTDDDGVTADDVVIVTVQPQAVLFPPTAVAGDDQSLVDADDDGFEIVALDGSASSDSDGTVVAYSWTLNDDELATTATASVSLPAGVNPVVLTVTDDFGLTGQDTVVVTIARVDPPVTLLDLLNRQSGISVSLSGINGSDWAVEHSFHDMSVGDQVIYLRDWVQLSLAHNENNSIMNRDVGLPGIIGVDGVDGVADTGDEGDIHFKIDRDLQSHSYTTVGGRVIPDWAPIYDVPFSFEDLTYDGFLPVLGSVGDNGQAWGLSPAGSVDLFAYGQNDRFGNEWHTLTYWDDDAPVYTATGTDAHRQGASDGHWVYICVNPITPIIQLTAQAGEQYYTTPLKTYHVPKTWDQTTYLTEGVEIAFVNMTNYDRVQYRVDGGDWQEFRGGAVTAGDLFGATNTPMLLEARCGEDGAIVERTVVMSPNYPASSENHGYMLWADDDEYQAVVDKLDNVQPFARSYSEYLGDYYQQPNTVYTDARGGWRSGAGMAGTALANAFATAIEGAPAVPELAAMAKTRLLRMARLEAVGDENGVSVATPSKDYLNELGQTIQTFADAGVAYDLLAAHYRLSDHPDGMTPIEELRIRDGLAEIAKTTLQVRGNWSWISGSGDTHWAHGYELAIGVIAAAMPTYATEYFGVSGGDMVSENDLSDTLGEFWNPFPTQGVTWWAAATDSEIETPGHPNVRAPLRAEFQISDDGYWTGPNDLKGDGDRYVTGPVGRNLVDVKSGGLANAECRVELVEMDGYESPFVGRIHLLDYIRRIRGDDKRQQCVTTYIRRRQLTGYEQLAWDAVTKTYIPQAGRAVGSLLAFNDHYEAAALPSSVALMSEFLADVNRSYGYEPGDAPDYIDGDRKALFSAYALALCADPTALAPAVPDANHAPIIKPMFKYVVAPGESLTKYILAMDLDDDDVTIRVSGLPTGASFDPAARTISWTPSASDIGVHVVRVTAADDKTNTSRPFPILVKNSLGTGPVPARPVNVTAEVIDDDVQLMWEAPLSVDVAAYVIYRDGALRDVVQTLSYLDTDLPAGSHTRYHVAVYDANGAESFAAAATPAIVSFAHLEQTFIDGDIDGNGVVDLADFVILKSNFGKTGVGWAQGDMSGDGKVDLNDFVILKTNFGAVAPAPDTTEDVEPEPTTDTTPDPAPIVSDDSGLNLTVEDDDDDTVTPTPSSGLKGRRSNMSERLKNLRGRRL